MLHPFRIKNPLNMSNGFPRSNKTVLIDESLMHPRYPRRLPLPLSSSSTASTTSFKLLRRRRLVHPNRLSILFNCLNEIPIPCTLMRNNAISGAVSPRLKNSSQLSRHALLYCSLLQESKMEAPPAT